MTNIYRYPLKLDRDDPKDQAIIQALLPFVRSRRAAHVIRDALYRVLCDGSSAVALPVSPLPSAKRVSVGRVAASPSLPFDDPAGDDLAFDALLESF